MAASLNKVFLMGNLTRDPDLRSLPSGSAVCEFGMAMNRRFVSNGQEVDETCFVDIVVWGRSAENCKQFLEKGSQVLVEGRLQFDQWEDRNGGGKRSRLRVVADQVQFLARRDGNSVAGGYGQAPQDGFQQNSYGNAPQGNYGGQAQGNYAPQQRPQRAQQPPHPGGMPRAPQADMPPMPPEGAFNPDDGMEDDIPF